MGLTKVTYSMIEGAVINALDYGVVGDGATDDTNALQAAIDSATLQNTLLYVPSGNYKITGTGLLAAPTTASNATFYRGERTYNLQPSIGAPKSWVCTVTGSPATWVSEGNL